MSRRAVANATVIVSVLLAMIAAGHSPVAPAYAATTTTINFDDLSAGTAVSNQYDAKGVDFEKGIINNGVYCYPVITAVASGQAESGTQVGDATCADGEFPDSSIWGVLKNVATHVSLYAGFFPYWGGAPANTDVVLTVYDADYNVISSDTETVPAGQGTHTLLQVASASANIAYFSLANSSDGNGGDVPTIYIDDLT